MMLLGRGRQIRMRMHVCRPSMAVPEDEVVTEVGGVGEGVWE